MTRLIDTYRNATVLAIGAHPDDVEISLGGTLARMSRAGARVVIAAVAVPSRLEERVAEARAAAEILGATFELLEVERCRRVEDLPSHELVRRLDQLIKRHRPDALFAHSLHEIHHDHVLVHRAVLASMRIRPMDVYFYQPSSCKPRPNQFQARAWVDISETIDAKIEAIAAHRSQFGGRGICVEAFRDMARSVAVPVGLQYAEPLDVHCMRS
jgi:LmbE family N-acetylglucosaminyl deacetylase